MPRPTPDNHRPAVIIGLNDAALSIVRSLGRKGIPVVGLYENPRDYCLHSKYLHKKLFQEPLHDEPLLHALTDKVAPALPGRAVLFCATDQSVLTVSKYQSELAPRFDFVLPDFDVAHQQINKIPLYEFAKQHSFLLPPTHVTQNVADLNNLAPNLLFPVLLKPHIRNEEWQRKLPQDKILCIRSASDLFQRISAHQLENTPLVVQQLIDGDDSEVYFCLAYISRTRTALATLTAKKLLQYPRLTGSTSIARSVPSPEVADQAMQFLRTAGIIGICSVEYKRCPTTGKFYLTEPTVGRPDTQESLALASGVDIPYIAYLDATHRAPMDTPAAGRTVTWINEPLTFYNLRSRPTEIRSLGAALANGPRAYNLFAADDLGPFIAFLADKAANLLPKRNHCSAARP